MKTAHLTLIGIAITSSACYYDNEEHLYPNNFCETTNVTWTLHIEPLVQNRCAIPGCHVSGAQAPDLSTFAGVQSNADAVRSMVVGGNMPPTGGLPACDRQQVQLWVDGGAQQN